MKLQLKVRLLDTKPPVWRKFELPSSFTFFDLHNLIQAAFLWEQSHLHSFRLQESSDIKHKEYRDKIKHFEKEVLEPMKSARSMNQEAYQQIKQRMAPEQPAVYEITSMDFPDIEEKPGVFDERNETIFDWLWKEGQMITYLYDFGEDHEHEVLLEQITAGESDDPSPVCLNVTKPNSRAEVSDEVWRTPKGNFSETRFRHYLNDLLYFVENFGTSDESDWEKFVPLPGVKENDLATLGEWADLFDEAREFYWDAPWRDIASADLFGFTLPETGERFIASVLGDEQEVYGLALYTGHTGERALYRQFFDPSFTADDLEALFLSFDDIEELEPPDHQLIIQTGYAFHDHDRWPTFRRLDPGQPPQFLKAHELFPFLHILPLVPMILDYFDSNPQALNGAETNVIPVFDEGELRNSYEKVHNVRLEPLFSEEAIGQGPPAAGDFEIPDNSSLEKLPMRNTHLYGGIFKVDSFTLGNSPAGTPIHPWICMFVDKKSEIVLSHDIATSQEEASQQFLQKFNQLCMNTFQGVPESVTVTGSKAATSLKTAISLVPTVMHTKKRIAVLENLVNDLIKQLSRY
ncbi:plasmid pRiA4b ORF-3 family protein [Marinococcus sp. PL1-022]|uniref:plasmid pRiA4b ORF-3 family protein n=1 Tax=Marinococcus sp. PL1-022 TaxID=3095363 RepID=UPI0029C1EC32|nr:plasmid pRiA4b ORF-3 family protein [Marinococcus sp. PL1-022]MDX6153696.1 plasmid pRiA4b ORF-3 family protein [Marinococcus sp. PL1-022]